MRKSFVTVEEALTRQREINSKLASLGETAEKRELNETEANEEKALLREYDDNKREIALLNQEAEHNRIMAVTPREENVNAKLHSFLREAKPGSRYEFAVSREAMSTADTTPYVQGLTVEDIIDTERADADIMTAAGVPMQTNVTGNKIQWPFMGGVEAVFANELAQTTERKVALDKQSPVQQRLTVRVRLSHQTIENSNFDLVNLFTNLVKRSVARKVNWAAASTTKATSVFYGGFAQDAESGTYGQAGYTPGKQVGTYETLSKEVFAEMIGKIAKRNIPTDHLVFVVGAEDYWKLKVTPMDAGSGIMLLGPDSKILGVPVIANNAINRATQNGALSGNAIGLGNFAAMPVMQHGSVRLSIDDSSAYAADTDEVIITINTDFSMTVLKDAADAFVVYTKGAVSGESDGI